MLPLIWHIKDISSTISIPLLLHSFLVLECAILVMHTHAKFLFLDIIARNIAVCAVDSGSRRKLYLLKYSKLKAATTFTRIQTITVAAHSFDLDSVIYKMALLGTGKDAVLYIGVSNTIYRIPVQLCDYYTMCDSCIRDPYCLYDVQRRVCKAGVNINEENFQADACNGSSGKLNNIVLVSRGMWCHVLSCCSGFVLRACTHLFGSMKSLIENGNVRQPSGHLGIYWPTSYAGILDPFSTTFN